LTGNVFYSVTQAITVLFKLLPEKENFMDTLQEPDTNRSKEKESLQVSLNYDSNVKILSKISADRIQKALKEERHKKRSKSQECKMVRY
jgi:flagellar biosynthesis/type III secretory pathway chaperone